MDGKTALYIICAILGILNIIQALALKNVNDKMTSQKELFNEKIENLYSKKDADAIFRHSERCNERHTYVDNGIGEVKALISLLNSSFEEFKKTTYQLINVDSIMKIKAKG